MQDTFASRDIVQNIRTVSHFTPVLSGEWNDSFEILKKCIGPLRYSFMIVIQFWRYPVSTIYMSAAMLSVVSIYPGQSLLIAADFFPLSTFHLDSSRRCYDCIWRRSKRFGHRGISKRGHSCLILRTISKNLFTRCIVCLRPSHEPDAFVLNASCICFKLFCPMLCRLHQDDHVLIICDTAKKTQHRDQSGR